MCVFPISNVASRERFNGSESLFTTQQDLVNCAGHAIWLTEFTTARLEHQGL